MSEAIEAKCHHCARVVGVRKNSGGFAFYRCPWCQFEGRHHSHRASDDYLRGIGAPPEPPAPPAVEKAGKSPEIAEKKPAAQVPKRSMLSTLLDTGAAS